MTSGISAALRLRVRAAAKERCGYCLARQEYVPLELEIEHIVPISKGGIDLALNLNNFVAVTVRRNWTKAGWHPPQD